jgi:hypothetical protein
MSLYTFVPGPARAQDTSRINGAKLALAATLTSGTVVAVHIYQRDAWWQGGRAPFHFENDWAYALNIDKFGHAYGSYSLAYLFQYIMTWVGFNRPTSVVGGSMLGLGYQLYVEAEDGFHKIYGFSPGDAITDIAGAMIPIAQETFPVLKNFRLKWSYYPSEEYRNALKTNKGRVFIDDYQGQIYWVGMDPHFIMGEGLSKVIPPWLGLSFGTAVRNLDTGGNGEKIFYLTLDYNFSQIETNSDFLRALFTALDFFHLPAPGFALEGRTFKIGVFY